jgi:hypothetical protein
MDALGTEYGGDARSNRAQLIEELRRRGFRVMATAGLHEGTVGVNLSVTEAEMFLRTVVPTKSRDDYIALRIIGRPQDLDVDHYEPWRFELVPSLESDRGLTLECVISIPVDVLPRVLARLGVEPPVR